MTPKETIDNLEDALYSRQDLNPWDEKDVEMITIAENALRARIQKIPKQDEDTRYHCPACDNWIAEYQHFCDNCGQAIDWGWKFEVKF